MASQQNTPELSRATFDEVFAAYRVFILDLDGTLMNGGAPIPGVADTVFDLMTDPTKKVLVFSNGGYANLTHTWMKCVDWMKSELSAEKFAVIEPLFTKNIVYNTAQLTAKFLITKLQPNDKCLVFGNEGLVEELVEVGLRAEILRPMLPGETEYSPALSDTAFGTYELDPEVKAIAKGVCFDFDQRKLAVASMYLQQPETQFVVTNVDPVFVAGGNGRLMPDVGATLAALETACGRKAQSVGKPGAFGMKAMLADHFADESADWEKPEYLRQFCYVGDNIETDVGFCKNAGIGSVLVLSGLATEADAPAIIKANPNFILGKFSKSD